MYYLVATLIFTFSTIIWKTNSGLNVFLSVLFAALAGWGGLILIGIPHSGFLPPSGIVFALFAIIWDRSDHKNLCIKLGLLGMAVWACLKFFELSIVLPT